VFFGALPLPSPAFSVVLNRWHTNGFLLYTRLQPKTRGWRSYGTEALHFRENEVLRCGIFLTGGKYRPEGRSSNMTAQLGQIMRKSKQEGKHTSGSEHDQQRQTIKHDGPAGSNHEEVQARGKTYGSEHDQQAPGNLKATAPERVAGSTSARSASVLPDKILEKQRKERESIVKEANDIYAQQEGVRNASYSTVVDFYKGLDRWLSILVRCVSVFVCVSVSFSVSVTVYGCVTLSLDFICEDSMVCP
jgi:hypothetical protein